MRVSSSVALLTLGQGELYRQLAKSGRFSETLASRVSQPQLEAFHLMCIRSTYAKSQTVWLICTRKTLYTGISSPRIYYLVSLA
jgi:hypothetical protein